MKNLLEQLKIEKIISIDDSWGENTTVIDLKLDILEYCKTHRITLNDEEIEEIELLDEGNFEELSHKNSKLFDKIYRFKDREHDEALKSLDEIFEDKLEKYSSVKDFEENLNRINPSEFILFIIDINMEKSGGEKNNVLDLLEIIEKDYKNVSIVIYSNEQNEIERLKDINKRKAFLKEKNKDIKYMTLIHPLKKGEEKLVEGLKEKMLTSYLYVMLNNYLEEKKKIDEIIYNGIYCSELYEFHEKLVTILSSGESVTDLIRRLFHSLYDKKSVEDSSYLLTRKELIKSANKYKENINHEINMKLTEWSPNSLIDFSVNKTYKDIYPGDLFELKIKNEIKYGLIINKSCHILIREQKSEGKIDRKKNSKKIKMLIFENKKIQDSNSKKNAARNSADIGECIWPYKINEDGTSISLQNTNEVMFFDDIIVDMTSLDKNGESKLTSDLKILDINILDYKTLYSKQYFESLNLENILNVELKRALLEFKNVQEKDLSIEEKKQLTNELIKDLSIRNNNIDINISENIEFGIKRVGRLHDDKTLIVYQNYLFDISQRGIDGAL